MASNNRPATTGREKKAPAAGGHPLPAAPSAASTTADNDTNATRPTSPTKANATSLARRKTIASSAVATSPIDEIPAYFICPITLEIMKDPTITTCGHMFEREAITSWCSQSDTTKARGCPMCHEPIDTTRVGWNENVTVRVDFDQF